MNLINNITQDRRKLMGGIAGGLGGCLLAICLIAVALRGSSDSESTPLPTRTRLVRATPTEQVAQATLTFAPVAATPTVRPTSPPVATQLPTVKPTQAPAIVPTMQATSLPVATQVITAWPTQAPVIMLTNPPTSALCNCAASDYNCTAFKTQKEAQACYNSCGGTSANNKWGLDRDHDGRVCETLP